MDNKHNAELLNFLRQNAGMGLNTLKQINSIIQPGELRKTLEKQLLEYKNVFDQCTRKLESLDQEIKNVCQAVKTTAGIMINVKTITDKSDEKIAKMIIEGSTMGIIEINKKLKYYVDADDDYKNIGYKLLVVEQKDIDEMKHFL